jgi:hypothetical protein
MTQQTHAQSTQPELTSSVPSFQSLLAIGAMLAALAVVTFACLQSDEGAVRVHSILQGAEVILLTWSAGIIASALQRVSLASDRIALRFGRSARDAAFT